MLRILFRKLAIFLLTTFILATASGHVNAANLPERYTVQIASMSDRVKAQKLYATLRADLGPELHSLLRVELIGALHAFRIGAFADRAQAQNVLEGLRTRHPDASILLAPVLPERIFLPKLPSGDQPAAEPTPQAEVAQAQAEATPERPAPRAETSRPAPEPPHPPGAAASSQEGSSPSPRTDSVAAPPGPAPSQAKSGARSGQTPSLPVPTGGSAASATAWNNLVESLSNSWPLLTAALASALLLPLALLALLRAVRRRPAAAGPAQVESVPAPVLEDEDETPGIGASSDIGPEDSAFSVQEPSEPEPDVEEPDAEPLAWVEPPGRDAASSPDAHEVDHPTQESPEPDSFTVESATGTMKNAEPPLEEEMPALSPEFLGRMARNGRELSQVQGNLLSTAKEGKSFYVTSCFNGEGKTTAAVEMAYALSHSAGARVLLVDWNPGAARLHELFDVSVGPGFADYLASGDAHGSIRATTHPNLSLLTAGVDADAFSGGGNGAGRRRLRDRLSALRDSFDYVIYDGHSLIGTSAAILAREFDGIVLVVEAEKTKWEVVQSAREKIESIDGRLVGVVLNKRKFYIPRFLYGKF